MTKNAIKYVVTAPPKKLFSFELKDESSKAFAISKLKALLRRESAFAAFKRCYVRQYLNRYPKLEEFVKLD